MSSLPPSYRIPNFCKRKKNSHFKLINKPKSCSSRAALRMSDLPPVLRSSEVQQAALPQPRTLREPLLQGRPCTWSPRSRLVPLGPLDSALPMNLLSKAQVPKVVSRTAAGSCRRSSLPPVDLSFVQGAWSHARLDPQCLYWSVMLHTQRRPRHNPPRDPQAARRRGRTRPGPPAAARPVAGRQSLLANLLS